MKAKRITKNSVQKPGANTYDSSTLCTVNIYYKTEICTYCPIAKQKILLRRH